MIQIHIFLLVLCVGAIRTVPLKDSGLRVRRDAESTDNTTLEFSGCILDEIEYKAGQEVPSLGPCEQCVCEAPDVVCSMIKCQPNSGCRIIQQSGQCCPEYKCDCEYNGKIYNNGERLDKPEDPCQVCYCKGGEIMCTSVTCYERNDCQPHFSPGQCCPKYDHCPVESNKVSNNSVRSVNASVYSPKREMQPWPFTKPSNAQSSVNYDESNGSHNNIFPQTIKIVEILPTTPDYVNKPSEVSVIPRVKTNDENYKSDYTKDTDFSSLESSTTVLISTTENLESSTASSTSEVDHLLDTTPQLEEESEKQIVEAVPERSRSTINPLSEEIYSTSTHSPEAHPDSQKMATILPGFYSSEGSKYTDSEESATTDMTTEMEGTGYELLKGGIYEDYSSESPEFASLENSTDITENVNNQTSHETNVETTNESQDVPSYEAYTGTETYSSEGYSYPSARMQIESNTTNDTSTEVFDLDSSSVENKSDIQENSSSNSENSASTSENSSSTSENSSSTSENSSSTSESSNSEESTSEEKSFESPDSSRQNTTEDYNNTTSDSTSNNEEYTENITLGLENNPNAKYDELSTVSQMNSEVTTFNSTGDIDEVTVANLLSNDTLLNTTDLEDSLQQSTQSYDFSEINESTTNKVAFSSKEPDLSKDQNKKMSRLAYRKLDTSDRDSETSATLQFPSVLKVQALGTEQVKTQTESVIQENTTSMAKVGIYHPTKLNESTGYLTIVDEKVNSPSSNVSTFPTPLLLTPNDLKKLAEILIHEKIKPVTLQKVIQGKDKNLNDSSIHRISNTVSSKENESSSEASNQDFLNSTTELSTDGTFPKNTGNQNETIIVIQDEQESNGGPDAPQKSMTSENLSEDPNTSRQIRIPDGSNPEYSALLDDRDLLILENFFRKNMGLH